MAKNNLDNYKLTLKNGRTLSTLDDLYSALSNISDDVFYYHVNENRNDFYNWVKDVFKNNKLAEDLLECSTKEAALFCLINSLDNKKYNLIDNPKLTLSLLKELPSLEFGNPLDNRKIIEAVKKGYNKVILKDVQQSKPLVTFINLDSIKKSSLKNKNVNRKVLKEEFSLDTLSKNIQKVKITSPGYMINILKGVHEIE